MTVIKIAINSVNDVNEVLNSIKRNTGEVRNSVASLKNSVFNNIQARRNIRGRIQSVENKISEVETSLGELYSLINYSTNSYSVTEKELKKELEDRV